MTNVLLGKGILSVLRQHRSMALERVKRLRGKLRNHPITLRERNIIVRGTIGNFGKIKPTERGIKREISRLTMYAWKGYEDRLSCADAGLECSRCRSRSGEAGNRAGRLQKGHWHSRITQLPATDPQIVTTYRGAARKSVRNTYPYNRRKEVFPE